MHAQLFALMIGALLPGGAAAEDAKKSDHDTIQGDWVMVSSESEDGKADERDLKQRKLRIQGDRWWRLTGNKTPGVPPTFKLDPAKSPKEVDLEAPAPKGKSGVVTKGIYKLDGDTLTVCRASAGSTERPTEFKAAKGVVLDVYKRPEKK